MTPLLPPLSSSQQDIVGTYRRKISFDDIFFLLMILGSMVGVTALSLSLLPAFRVLPLLLLPLLGYIFVKNARDIYGKSICGVTIYRDAIIEQCHYSSRVFLCKDIAYIWDYGLITSVGATYTIGIQTVSGQQLILHDMESRREDTSYRTHNRDLDLMDVRQYIIDNVLPRLSEQSVAHYGNGQDIDFLVFSIGPAGLRYQEEWRAWHEIEEIAQVDDVLRITFNGIAPNTFAIPFTTIPNIDVLVAVLRRYHGDKYQITQQYKKVP